jgi:hypothetical protein
MGGASGGVGADQMQTTFSSAVESYLRAKPLARGTRNEYYSTLRKWEEWGGGASIEELRRRNIREFLESISVPSIMKVPIRAVLQTRPANISAPSSLGLGNRNSSKRHRGSPSRGISATWRVGTT